MNVFLKRSGSSVDAWMLVTMTCVQCDTLFTGVIYGTARWNELSCAAVDLWRSYYAPYPHRRCVLPRSSADWPWSVGANSAAVTMFRGALYDLLFEQGFKREMWAGQKLADLETAVKANTAPKWAYELDGEFLIVMKTCDGAIHPNDGNVATQVKLLRDLLAKLTHTFQMLLFLIYELPHDKQKRLDGLKAGIIKK